MTDDVLMPRFSNCFLDEEVDASDDAKLELGSAIEKAMLAAALDTWPAFKAWCDDWTKRGGIGIPTEPFMAAYIAARDVLEAAQKAKAPGDG